MTKAGVLCAALCGPVLPVAEPNRPIASNVASSAALESDPVAILDAPLVHKSLAEILGIKKRSQRNMRRSW